MEPFKVGDIVEHTGYYGGLFEIVEKEPRVFDNRQFYKLKLWNSPKFLGNGARRRWRESRDEKGLVTSEAGQFRTPNEMEVLAIAWAKAAHE